MEEEIEQKHLDQKRERLAGMVEHVRSGLLCEMGCGSGLVLEFLSEQMPGSTVIGVDRSLEELKKAASRKLPGVFQVAAEIPERVFDQGIFDSVIFIWSMHEVYSGAGEAGLLQTLRNVRKMLKDGGVLIVQDFLRPPPRQVTLGFKTESALDRFRQFAREFRLHKVRHEEAGTAVRLDVGDAVEFISKFRIDDEDDWRHEMGEAHFFSTMEKHMTRARDTGFKVARAGGFPLRWEALDVARRDMDFDFEQDFSWVQLVLSKDAAG